MGWFVVILIPLAIGTAIICVPEPEDRTVRPGGALRGYVALLARDTVRRVLAAGLLLGLAPGIIAALFIFYFERAKDFDSAQVASLLLAYFLSALICAPLWPALARRVGKHRALSAAGLVVGVGQAAVAFVPTGDIWLAVAALMLVGVPYTAGPGLLRSMLADVVDEERLASGADRKGLLYATLAAMSKLGYALAVGITFVALDLLGFVAEAGSDPDEGLAGLQMLFVIAPGLCGLLAAWACFGYPLDASRHAEIRAQLALRDRAVS
jgi:Na+/melibiose symporter-like transporter